MRGGGWYGANPEHQNRVLFLVSIQRGASGHDQVNRTDGHGGRAACSLLTSTAQGRTLKREGDRAEYRCLTGCFGQGAICRRDPGGGSRNSRATTLVVMHTNTRTSEPSHLLGNWRVAMCTAVLAAALVVASTTYGASVQNGQWVGHGPEGGEVTSIVVSHQDPDHVFAATCGGGVYRSTDAGRTWRRWSNGIDHPCVTSLVMDPADALVLYAGTDRTSVYRTGDGGLTWREGNDGLRRSNSHKPVLSLAVSFANPGWVFAGVDDSGLFVSIDAGVHWNKVDFNPPWRWRPEGVAIGGSSFLEVVYATDYGVVRSTDGGRNWEEATVGFSIYVYSIAVHPVQAGVVYAGASQVWTSTDMGATWSKTTGQPDHTGKITALTVVHGQPDEVYAGTDNGVWRSTDAGFTWEQLGNVPLPMNARVSALAVSPSGDGDVLVGTDGDGVFRWAGTEWAPSRNGLEALPTRLIAVAPSSDGRAWVVTGRRSDPLLPQIYRTNTAGKTWVPANEGVGGALYPSAIVVDPIDPDHLLLASDRGIHATDDGALSWVKVYTDMDGVAHIAFAPSDPDVVYAAAGHRFLRSTDSGWTWTETEFEDAGFVRIAVSPEDPLVVWAVYGQGSAVVRSRDGGATWIDTGLDLGWDWGGGKTIPRGSVVSLEIDPELADVVYVALSTYELWRHDPGDGDQGVWQRLVAPAERMSSLVADRTHAGRLILGTPSEGIWLSPDRGRTWEQFDHGLSFQPSVKQLAISPSRFNLWAATTGGAIQYHMRLTRRAGSRRVPATMPDGKTLKVRE